MKKQLIIGLGTGRCGTVSLYRLLNYQNNSFFTHQSKPLLTQKFHKKDIDKKLKNLFDKQEDYVGDVNSCYLPYVKYICERYPLTKFIVLKRPKKEVVLSFFKHTERKKLNPWMNHDGKKWKKVKKWDDMNPKYKSNSKEEAIERYWEDYNKKVNKLIKKYPKNIKLFKTEDLNSEKGVREILDFCNFEKKDQKIKINIKENRYKERFGYLKYRLWKADKI